MENKAQQLVSIVIAVYNSEKYLRGCLDSVLSQTHTNLDIVLVNDGSADSSLEICREYAATDSRITVIDRENGGPAAAKRTGTLNAKGEYVVYVDNDDHIDKTFIENLLLPCHNNNFDLVIAQVKDHNRVYQNSIPNGNYMVGEFIECCFAEKPDVFSKMMTFEFSKLYKTKAAVKAFEKIDIGIKVYDDHAFNFLYLPLCKRLYVTDSCEYLWVKREDSFCHSKDKMKDQILYIYKLYFLMKIGLNEYDCIYRNCLSINIIKRILGYLFVVIASMRLNDRPLEVSKELKAPNELERIKIAIYGAGQLGQHAYIWLDHIKLKPVIWVDKNYRNIVGTPQKVCAVEDILSVDYDYVLISLGNENTVKEVCAKLISLGVPQKKILDVNELL